MSEMDGVTDARCHMNCQNLSKSAFENVVRLSSQFTIKVKMAILPVACVVYVSEIYLYLFQAVLLTKLYVI